MSMASNIHRRSNYLTKVQNESSFDSKADLPEIREEEPIKPYQDHK